MNLFIPPAILPTALATPPIAAPMGPPNAAAPVAIAGAILLTVSNPFFIAGPILPIRFFAQLMIFLKKLPKAIFNKCKKI